MTEHPEKEATCGTAGNVKYYSCSRCNKNFSDQNGNTELSDVVISATGNHRMTDETWSSDDTNHWHVCDTCNAVYDKAAHVFEEKTESGKDYKKCKTCGKETDIKETKESSFEVDTALGNVSIVKTGDKQWTLTYTGTGVSYVWSCVDTSVTLSSSTSVSTGCTVSATGTYNVTCTAKDSSGNVVDIATAVLTAK